MKVVIVGGGIIGCSTAYYLTKLGAEVVLIEQQSLACSASGKAGGFLARDWAAGPLGQLCRFSFELYKQLSEEFGADFLQYRPLDAYAGKYTQKVSVRRQSQVRRQSMLKKKDVFNGAFDQRKLTVGLRMGSKQANAQVTPGILTKELFKRSKAQLIIGQVVGVNFYENDNAKIQSVVVDINGTKKNIEGDEFCFCMGPWSDWLVDWGFKVPRSHGLKVHSVILQPKPEVHERLPPVAIFTDFNNCEIYPRLNGSVYICGSEAGAEVVKYHPRDLIPHEGACEKIINFWNDVVNRNGEKHGLFDDDEYNASLEKDFAEELEEGKFVVDKTKGNGAGINEMDPEIVGDTAVLVKQVCHLPVIDHDFQGEKLPVLSEIPDTINGYICAGHSCWGILCGPASGMIMADYIFNNDPHKHVDISAFQLQ